MFGHTQYANYGSQATAQSPALTFQPSRLWNSASGQSSSHGSHYSQYSNVDVRVVSMDVDSSTSHALCTSDREQAVKALAAIDAKLVDWTYMSTLALTADEYAAYTQLLNWTVVSEHVALAAALKMPDKIVWDAFMVSHDVGINSLQGLTLDWDTVIKTQTLTVDDIEKNIHQIEKGGKRRWKLLCKYQVLSEAFLEKHWHSVDKRAVSVFQQLSYDFLKKYICDLDINAVEVNQSLSTAQRICLGNIAHAA